MNESCTQVTFVVTRLFVQCIKMSSVRLSPIMLTEHFLHNYAMTNTPNPFQRSRLHDPILNGTLVSAFVFYYATLSVMDPGTFLRVNKLL